MIFKNQASYVSWSNRKSKLWMQILKRSSCSVVFILEWLRFKTCSCFYYFTDLFKFINYCVSARKAHSKWITHKNTLYRSLSIQPQTISVDTLIPVGDSHHPDPPGSRPWTASTAMGERRTHESNTQQDKENIQRKIGNGNN